MINLQRIRRVFGRKDIESGISRILSDLFDCTRGSSPDFESNIHIFKENKTQNLKVTPKVHVLVHHVPKYVRRTGVPLWLTSELALKS